MSVPTRARRSAASSIRAMGANARPTASANSSTSRPFTSRRWSTRLGRARADPLTRLALPEPFGQHIFGAAADLHPLVQRRWIGAAVGEQIVPREQLAGFRLD